MFLGSGLLFVAMIFAGAAITGGLIAEMPSSPPSASTLALGRDVASILFNVYAMRMAAVFTLTTVTIARRTQIVSRWLTVAGLVCALVLLVGIGISPWVELLFPAWILALSIDILAAGRGPLRAPRKRRRTDRRTHTRVSVFDCPKLPRNLALKARCPADVSRVARNTHTDMCGLLSRMEGKVPGFALRA